MKVDVTREEFVAANLLELDKDVESVFQVDASIGIQGQLLRLQKSDSINVMQGLNILQGRLACIGEEWDYAEFQAEHWANVFDPPQEFSVYLLKSFEVSNAKLFIDKLDQFKNHYLLQENQESSSRVPSFFGSYKFNGENVADYLNQVKAFPSISDLKVNPFDPSENFKVFSNTDLWNWQLWFVETDSDYFLFEEIIIS